MEKKIRYLLIVLLYTFYVNSARAQWVQTGPKSGTMNALTCYNGIIYGGAEKGYCYSTDNGNTWNIFNDGLSTSTDIHSILVNDTCVYTGTTNGVYILSKSNTTWKQSGLTDLDITCFASDGTTIYAGTYNSGVCKSIDNGVNWTEVNNGLIYPGIRSLLIKGSAIFVGTEGGVYKSIDQGTSWTAANNGLPDNTVYALTLSGTNILATVWSWGIYMSTDNGESWNIVNNGLPTGDLHLYAFTNISETTILTGGTEGVFLSSDGGQSWTAINNGLPQNGEIYALAYNSGNFIAGTLYDGVYISSDNGKHWSQANSGLHHNIISNLAVINNMLFAGTRGGLFSWEGNETEWSNNFTPGLSQWGTTAIGVNGEIILAGNLNGEIYLSTDNGNVWEKTGRKTGYITSFAFLGANVFLTTSSGELYISNDNCATLNRVTNGLPTGDFAKSVINIGTDIFVIFSVHGIYLSTDNGTTWTESDNGLPSVSQGLYITSFAAGNGVLFVGTDGQGIFKSIDNGTNWKYIGLPNKRITSLIVNNNNLFAATSNDGIFLQSVNDSIQYQVGLSGIEIISLAIYKNELIAGTRGNGIWHRPLSQLITDVNKVESKFPSNFSLSQNFPNPFNPSTTINYQISNSGHVELKIYDILGREAAVLVNEVQKAGNYSIRFNTNNSQLAGGVYFYRLKCNGFSSTKKLLLLK